MWFNSQISVDLADSLWFGGGGCFKLFFEAADLLQPGLT